MAGKRFQETVGLQRVDTRTGAAQGLANFAQTLRSFESMGGQVAKAGYDSRRRQLTAKGAASGSSVGLERDEKGMTKAPSAESYKENSFLGGIEARAHNKALRGAYLASLNNDIRTNVARIEKQNPKDIINFNNEITAWSNGMLGNVDPAARPMVAQTLQDRITTSRIAVQTETIAFQHEAAKNQIEVSAETTRNEATELAGNGHFEAGLKSAQSYGKHLDTLVESKSMTPAVATKKKREALIETYTAYEVGQVRLETQRNNTQGAISLIKKSREEILPGESEPEHQARIAAMMTEMREGIALYDQREKDDADYVKKLQEETYSNLFLAIKNGTAGFQDIERARRDGKLNNTQMKDLTGIISTKGQGINDFILVDDIRDMIRDGAPIGAIRAAIYKNNGKDLTMKTAGELLEEANESLDTESVLNTGESKRAIQRLKDWIVPTGPMGAVNPGKLKKYNDKYLEWANEVKAGANPMEAAQKLIDPEEYNRIPKPIVGKKEDPDQAMALLAQAHKDKIIDTDTFRRDYNNMIRVREMKWIMEGFDRERKEAAQMAAYEKTLESRAQK